MAQTQTQFNSIVTLSANSIVEKCIAKMANDVTEKVRDKLIDIIIAVLARECEDFDGEAVRRLIVAELETTPVTFTLEKQAGAVKESKPKTIKTKVVELDADGNPVKKVRAPKAAKPVLTEEEREAAKAAKKAEKDAEREARKAAKQAEREAAKAAKKAEREAAKAANKDADKEAEKEAAKAAKLAEREAAKAAKVAEREAIKAAKKAEREAEKEAAKAAKLAEKEAAKAAKEAAPKEQRIPVPWCGRRIEGRCEALRVYHGLYAQCTADATEISAFCPSCEKSGAKFGTCAMRAACGLFDYTDPAGKKCLRLANIVDKFGVEGGLEAFVAEAAKHDITIPEEHLTKEVKQRGRPKSNSPRAKVATSDTGSGSDTETEDEEQQQKRKEVTKVAAMETPKKRGRPAKNPKSDVAPSDEVIQDLVASAAAMSISAPSTPVAAKPSTEMPGAPMKPKGKAVTLKSKKTTKPVEREVRMIDEQAFWVDTFMGVEILIRQEDNATFEASNGEPLGYWDNVTKSLIEEDEEDEE